MAKYDKTKKYWLQLKEDWFEEDAIRWLEEQQNGEKYSLFYLKMCLKSIKLGGFLIRQVGTILIPYDKNSLADLTKTDVDTVVVAMRLLEEIGLITIKEDGAIYIEQVIKMIGCATEGAIRKQIQRSTEERMLTISENNNYVKLAELVNCKRIDASRILLPNGKVVNIDEKRYGGNAGLLYDLTLGKCEDCGSEENICIHHENGYNNDLENLVVLCSKCHGLHHRKDYISKKYIRGTAVRSMSTKDKDIIKDKDKDKEIYKEKENLAHTPIQKNKCGKYNNVLLTEEEKLNILKQSNGEKAIDHLSAYINRKKSFASNSHYDDILSWVFTALKEQEIKEEELRLRENKLKNTKKIGRKYDAKTLDSVFDNIESLDT